MRELGFYRADDVFEILEVAIVQATTACELPHSLDQIEFGTVQGKEIQSKVMGVLFPPRSVQAGVVITSIVDDDHNPSPSPAAGGAELLEKLRGTPISTLATARWAGRTRTRDSKR